MGNRLPLCFTLPGSTQEIQTTAEVTWIREFNPMHPETKPGMGLRFLDLGPTDQERVNRYIRSVQEPLFHPQDDDELP